MPHPTWCTALTEEGRECLRPRMEGAPLSLCQLHMLMAAMFIKESGGVLAEHVAPGTDRVPDLMYRHKVASVVYYIRFGERVKIGTTTDLRGRLRILPHDEVLAVEPGSFDRERARHHQFGDAHAMREWFDLTPELAAHVARVRRTFGDPMVAWSRLKAEALGRNLDVS